MSRCSVLPFLCLLTLALLGAGESSAGKPAATAKPLAKSAAALKIQQVRAFLSEMIDLKKFQAPMTLKEALGLLQDQLNAKFKEEDVLPILIDAEAFKEENPDAPDVYDTQVKFPPFPRKMSVATALRMALSKVPTNNATYLVRGAGFIEVTTYERASVAARLSQRVKTRFERVPLDEALHAVAEETGITVLVDARLARQTKTLVSADLTDGVSLRSALFLLADMGGLRGVVTSDALYFTSPENARRLLRESGGTMTPLLPGAPPDKGIPNAV